MSSEDCPPSKHQNEFLPYQLDYIPEELIKRAKCELSEDEETRVCSLRMLRSKLKDETDLQWLDEDLFLLAFLRSRKFDVERAFQLMQNFYYVIKKHGELFKEFNFADVRRTAETNFLGYLPYRDSEGSVIVVLNSAFWDPPDVTQGDLLRALTCALLHACLSPATQSAGYKAIIDCSDLTLRKLTHLRLPYLWVCANGLQNCFPGRFREIHVVNQGPLFSYVWNIAKQLLSKKIKKRFHFHGKNVEKLRKYFSPSILPVEYGGELPPFDNTEWRMLLEEKADYYGQVFSHAFQKRKPEDEENQNRR